MKHLFIRTLGLTAIMLIPTHVLAVEFAVVGPCLLYTSDAADERSSVDLGGRRIIKKKKRHIFSRTWYSV